MATLLLDSRVAAVEVTEFSALRDYDGSQAIKLVELLADVIGQKASFKEAEGSAGKAELHL